MKKIIFAIAIAALSLVSCKEKSEPAPQPELNPLTDTVYAEAIGGNYSFRYELSNAPEGAAVTASENSDGWILNLDYTTIGTVTFEVLENTGSTERKASIHVSYEQLDFDVAVVQAGAGETPGPDNPIDIEGEIAGEYKGGLSISIAGMPVVTDMPKNILINAAGENTINLEITAFSIMGMTLGTISLSDCLVERAENGYAISTEQTITLEGIGDCDVTMAGTVNNGELSLDLDIAVASPGGNVTVTFEGTRLTGSESSEADILTFEFDPENGANAAILMTDLGGLAEGVINVTVDGNGNISAVVPTITVSSGATVIPASGEPIDLTGGTATYTVVAEDGTVKSYSVATKKSSSSVFYSFDNWTETGGTPEVDGWASCNAAVNLIMSMGSLGGITYTGDYPVRPTDDSMEGKAVIMESVDTQGGKIFGQKIPKVTSGSIFLGTFNAFAAIQDPLSTTQFGIMFDQKPLVLRGYYKYTAGSEFYDENGTLVPGTTDECSVSAVLYEVTSDSEDEVLDGNDIYTSDRITAIGQMTSGSVSEFTLFNVNMEYKKEYNPDGLYRLAIIFSSSKEGNAYRAAVGSTMIVDNLTLYCE